MTTTETDTSQYALLVSEFPAISSLIRFQEQYGNGATAPGLDAYFTAISDLLAAYPQVQNPLFKEWYEKIFTFLSTVPTLSSDIPLPVFYMLWNYKSFCNRQNILAWRYNDPNSKSQWTSYWHTFVQGQTVIYDAIGGLNQSEMPRIGDSINIGQWAVPASPKEWHDSISAKITAWGDSPPATVIINTDHRFQVTACIVLVNGDCHPYLENAADGMPLYFEQAKLLNTWQNFTTTAIQTPGVIATSQAAAATDLLKPLTITAEAYFFLLHLLIALGTSNEAGQQMAAKVVSAPASSVEYPNDTFINQLIYLVLMYLIDPIGNYGWNNGQLQVAVSNLAKLITSKDAASAAIRQSLENHLKVLISDASYPMQDPYCPNIGFNTRQADTLDALDTARVSIHP